MSTRVEVEVTVNRPPGEVFDFISNFENNPRWQSGVKEASFTSDGPLGVGSTYQQSSKFLGRRIETSFEIIAFEPGVMVKARSTSGSFPITFTRSVEPLDEGTRVTAVIEGDASGFFKLAEPLLNRMVERQIKSDYAALKELLETSYIFTGRFGR
jgi:uncharacterized membrane protein